MLNRLSRFGRDTRAAAAMEFAMIGPVFMVMLLSMLETGWLIAKISMLDDAVADASKMIYVGDAPDKDALETAICDSAFVFPNCKQNINVELTVISTHVDIPSTAAECKDAGDDEFEPTVEYNTGGAEQVVFIRVCITTDVITPGLGVGLSLPKTANDRYEVIAATAFMNEPF